MLDLEKNTLSIDKAKIEAIYDQCEKYSLKIHFQIPVTVPLRETSLYTQMCKTSSHVC